MAGRPNPGKATLWQQRFAEFESSSMTVSEFCQLHNCSAASFYQWRRKLKNLNSSNVVKDRANATQSGSAFVPVKLNSSASSLWPLALPATQPTASVVALLANGTKLEFSCDPLAALASVLHHQELNRSC